MPVVFEIKIPRDNQVLILGGEFGMVTQREVLLNRNCTLIYNGKKYSLLNRSDEKKSLYALILMFTYQKN